jgi:hypothetical protein
MAGRTRQHWGCTDGPSGGFRRGHVVNAYVRLGNPARWIVVGEVCIDCGQFTKDVSFDPVPRPRAPTQRRRRR